MKNLVLVGLIAITGVSFAEPVTTQPQPPTQPSMPSQPSAPSQSQASPMPPQPLPTSQPTPPPQLNSMPPVEIKPEDKAIINLKKKMTIKQTYNDYQKVDKATNIDRLNLEKSLKEAKYSLKMQIYKEKQLDSQLPYPYYYNIPIAGVVGNIALTSQTPLKDGTVLKGKDKISVKDGLVYVGDYLVSYPVMSNIKQPSIGESSTSSSSAPPQLLTGLPTISSSNSMTLPSGAPPIPLPPPK